MNDEIDPSEPFAVLLLNLGGPDTISAIRPFLQNLFSDRSIIKLPIQPITARIIARSRARKVAARYLAIGGGSPILKLTQDQAQKLEEALKKTGKDCRAYVGMSYWHPFIREAVDEIEKDGFKQIIVLSMFPHYSGATTGSCLLELESILNKRKSSLKVGAIQSWYDDKRYLDALAESVEDGLTRFTESPTVLFSAHSLPQDFVDRGDPYPKHLDATIQGVLDRIGPVKWSLAFQSRSGPVKWMEPQTDNVIKEMGDSGVKNLLVVPISFVSDHIETLYEIDIQYKKQALDHGVEKFERSPSLNSSSLFIEALAGITSKRLTKSAAQ